MSSAILNTEALYIGFWFNQWEKHVLKVITIDIIVKAVVWNSLFS